MLQINNSNSDCRIDWYVCFCYFALTLFDDDENFNVFHLLSSKMAKFKEIDRFVLGVISILNQD